MKYETFCDRLAGYPEVHMFVILPRVLPRATEEILIMVFDRDPDAIDICTQKNDATPRRLASTTSSSVQLSHLRFMLTFYILGAQRGGRAIVIREEFVPSVPLCVAIFSGKERDS